MKPICLGTAMWGWSVAEISAFKIMDSFYDNGGRYIDSALNYPINAQPEDQGAALLIIAKWLKKNNINDLKLMIKIGSLDNSHTSTNNLTPEALQKSVSVLSDRFNTNIYNVMIHWDNRDAWKDIFESLIGLKKSCDKVHCRLGLSGIRHIESYKTALLNAEVNSLDIQVKSNFLFQGEKHYSAILDDFADNAIRFWGYGISGSGLKLSAEEYKKDSYVSLVRSSDYHRQMLSPEMIKSMRLFIEQTPFVNNIYHLSILIAENNPLLYGYMISPSKIEQLDDIFHFRKLIKEQMIQASFIMPKKETF